MKEIFKTANLQNDSQNLKFHSQVGGPHLHGSQLSSLRPTRVRRTRLRISGLPVQHELLRQLLAAVGSKTRNGKFFFKFSFVLCASTDESLGFSLILTLMKLSLQLLNSFDVVAFWSFRRWRIRYCDHLSTQFSFNEFLKWIVPIM